jgi:hypothetical protein
MKMLAAILATAAATWIAATLYHGTFEGAQRLWLVSAIKVPGTMAIAEIQGDLRAGRYEIAKAKIDALMVTWQRFAADADSFSGAGIGDIMQVLSKVEVNDPSTSSSNP